jgi:hypothetical protein
MAKTKDPANPFYVLLVVLGVVFLVTACAYSVMAFLANAPQAERRLGDHPMTAFLDRHGVALMIWELGLLGAASLAAMVLDRSRSLRRRSDADRPAAKVDAEPGRKME